MKAKSQTQLDWGRFW